jgi:hypothetical protein
MGGFIPTVLGQVAKFVHFIPQKSSLPWSAFNHTRPPYHPKILIPYPITKKQNSNNAPLWRILCAIVAVFGDK